MLADLQYLVGLLKVGYLALPEETSPPYLWYLTGYKRKAEMRKGDQTLGGNEFGISCGLRAYPGQPLGKAEWLGEAGKGLGEDNTVARNYCEGI